MDLFHAIVITDGPREGEVLEMRPAGSAKFSERERTSLGGHATTLVEVDVVTPADIAIQDSLAKSAAGGEPYPKYAYPYIAKDLDGDIVFEERGGRTNVKKQTQRVIITGLSGDTLARVKSKTEREDRVVMVDKTRREGGSWQKH